MDAVSAVRRHGLFEETDAVLSNDLFDFGSVPGNRLEESPQALILPAGPVPESFQVVTGGALLDERQGLEDAQAVPAVVEVGRRIPFHLLARTGLSQPVGSAGRRVDAQVLRDQVLKEANSFPKT